MAETEDRPFSQVFQREGLHTIECAPRDASMRLPAFAIQIEEAEVPVFLRRRTTPGLMSGEGGWKTIHVLGRERDGAGTYLFWDDELHVVMTNNRDLI
jgi:hypothetical protein